MAVKLMPVAPVAPEQAAPAPKHDDVEQPKPRKRRRAAVYDSDGHEVLITLKCLKCSRMHPLSNFGLRRMADGAIRNQPWCRECRGASSPKKKKSELDAEALQVPAAPVAPEAVAPSQVPPEPPTVPQTPVGVDPTAPAYGAPMAVVSLTAEQVMRALAPQPPQAVPAVPTPELPPVPTGEPAEPS
jgi:hypothetical protein